MKIELAYGENMASLGQKLQQDVDRILEDFIDYINSETLFEEQEEYFDVDVVLKSNISPKSLVKPHHHPKHQENKAHTITPVNRIDSKMNPVEPYYYERVIKPKKKFIFRKFRHTAKLILGIQK